MEAAKQQSETVTELEADLVKARRQETAYTDAMEQLRTELDEAAAENAKLKASVPAGEKLGEFDDSLPDPDRRTRSGVKTGGDG